MTLTLVLRIINFYKLSAYIIEVLEKRFFSPNLDKLNVYI